MLDPEVSGIYIHRKVFFMGQWIRYGGFCPHALLRIWRRGKGNIEQRWMDEHIILEPGAKTSILKEHFVDDNQKRITFLINKHNLSASREMVDLLNVRYKLLLEDTSMHKMQYSQARRKRFAKEYIYAKLPAGLRAALYFFIDTSSS